MGCRRGMINMVTRWRGGIGGAEVGIGDVGTRFGESWEGGRLTARARG